MQYIVVHPPLTAQQKTAPECSLALFFLEPIEVSDELNYHIILVSYNKQLLIIS
jgi:hypothetical protein